MTIEVSPTASQQVAAEQLLAEPGRWSRGRSRETGAAFWLVQGSAGRAHYATAFGCSCPGFAYCGICSHVAACRIRERAEQPVRVVGQPKARPSYEDLYPADRD